MDNSLNQFSITFFAIQMAVLFTVVYGVYLFLKFKKKKMDQTLEEENSNS